MAKSRNPPPTKESKYATRITITTTKGLSQILVEDIIRKVSQCNGVHTIKAERCRPAAAPVGVSVEREQPTDTGPNLLDFMEDDNGVRQTGNGHDVSSVAGNMGGLFVESPTPERTAPEGEAR